MKKSILLLITAISIATSFALAGCKKERCYDCEKNAGSQINYSFVVAIGEEEKDKWEALGYKCDYNGDKMKKKK